MTELIKDPICEIETGPFLTGTNTMTFEQIGIYTILLFQMHQKGGFLTFTEMCNAIHRETIDHDIMKKFTREPGTDRFYHSKLRETMIRRAEERDKFVKMGQKRWQKPTTSENPQEIPGNGKVKRQIFVPPTLEEVEKEVKDRNSSVDAIKFWHFYDSKDWMVGKNKMKNWRSALVTWERDNRVRGIDRGQHPGQIIVSGKVQPKFKTE